MVNVSELSHIFLNVGLGHRFCLEYILHKCMFLQILNVHIIHNFFIIVVLIKIPNQTALIIWVFVWKHWVPLFPFLEVWLGFLTFMSFHLLLVPFHNQCFLFTNVFFSSCCWRCCLKAYNSYKAKFGETSSIWKIRKHSAKPFYSILQCTCIISNPVLAYTTKSNFKTIPAYSIAWNVSGNSKSLSSTICPKRILGITSVALSFPRPLAAMLLCPCCKNTV